MLRAAAVTLAVLTAAAPAAASGPGFVGGHVEFTYSTTFGNSYSVLLPNGSASFEFGNGVVARVDGGMIGYSGGSEPM